MASTITIDLARTTVNELVQNIDAEWRALRTRNEVLTHRNERLVTEAARQREIWAALLDWIDLERGDHPEGTMVAQVLDRLIARMRRLQADDGRETCNECGR